ncbi:hypothetical protein V501_07588 [Pseudogymnoascus sp. VKM F-4519 (FW-2642)]|nr:hypothetical protein V501_07588 [Pseudogymnoascus sp. VKM F-4519 (FW-2642)]
MQYRLLVSGDRDHFTTLAFDPSTKRLSILADYPAPFNASWVNPISLHNGIDYLVGLSEGEEAGSLYCFDINHARESCKITSEQPTLGAPAHFLTLRDKSALALSTYLGGSIALYPISISAENEMTLTDGPRTELFPEFPYKIPGHGPNQGRQQQCHLHQILEDRQGLLYAPDLGSDRVWIIRRDASRMEVCGWLACPPGTGARHAVFSPDESVMYVIGELSHTVMAFDLSSGPANAILPIDGFAPNIIPPSIHPDHHLMLDASELCLHPTNPSVLYASNRWSRHIAQRQPELKDVPTDLPTGDDIAIILLRDDGKKVKALKHVRTNIDVIRGMRLRDDGKYAVVVGQEGGGIEIYSITGEAGDIWSLQAGLSEGLVAFAVDRQGEALANIVNSDVLLHAPYFVPMLDNENQKMQNEGIEHREDNISPIDSDDPFDAENIVYGPSGFKGLIAAPYILGVSFLASLAGFSFGYDQGVISIILTMPQFHSVFPEIAPGSPTYGFSTGFLTGMLELGGFIGCLFFPFLADKYSRKWGLSIAMVFYIIGAILQTAAGNYATLVAGRFIGGIGVGTLTLGAPLYIGEIAPPNIRGSLLVLEQFSIVIGAVLAYWVSYGCRGIESEWAFRLPFFLQMPSALIVGTCIHFFPFSPRWLSMKGRDEEALAALTRLRRLPPTDSRVQQEWKGITADVKLQQAIRSKMHPGVTGVKLEVAGWMDLFRQKYRKRTMVALAIPFFQQFSGVNAFVYYAPIFFQALGQNTEKALILSGMVNICQLVACIGTFLCLDHFGRRNLAIWGGIAMGIPHAIMAGIVGKYHSSWSSNTGVGWLGVALIYIYILCYGFTYGPLGWTLPAEVFPSGIRATGIGAAVAMNWLANTCIGFAVPQMQVSIGFGTYIFFASFCFIAAIFSYFCVPETKGLTLEQMDSAFGDDAAAEEQDVRREVVKEVINGV